MIEIIKKKPIIWSISGSDCSGGAGIAADIKTAHGLGVEICTLITANTVQNSTQLIAINPVSVDILQQQVSALIHDKPPSIIKVGLLVELAQVDWLTATLQHIKTTTPQLIVVYDPVGQASVGGNFNQLSLSNLTPLLKQVDVITPNINEAFFLASLASNTLMPNQLITNEFGLTKKPDPFNAQKVAEKIYQDFAIKSIIIKGGHSTNNDNECIDYCYHQLNQIKQDNQEKEHHVIVYKLSSPRLTNHYTHGGGCSFASALTACLAKGYLIRDAFTLAKAFINQGLMATQEISAQENHQYYGPFEQLTWPLQPASSISIADHFPIVADEINQQYQDLPAFEALDLAGEKLGLYPVIDSIEWLRRLLPLGLNIIQLRLKDLAKEKLEQVIMEAVNLAKNYKTRLFINDYWELAIKFGAYGVHIGQEDLHEADLASIHRAGLRLGISTHGCYEFLLAQQLQPSYLAIGAIFPTKTKDMTGQIQGVDNLNQLLALRSRTNTSPIPIVAIGGINFERAPNVLATTVDSIAVVTAITKANNPEQAVLALTDLIKTY